MPFSARRPLLGFSLVLCFSLATPLNAADGVEVSQAWARATVPGQKVAGAYLVIRSSQPARLIGVTSSSSKRAEIHSMSHEGGVMKMRQLPHLDLPAKQEVVLEPGGKHLMLLDLVKPLQAGKKVKLTLSIERAGKKLSVPVEAEVRTFD